MTWCNIMKINEIEIADAINNGTMQRTMQCTMQCTMERTCYFKILLPLCDRSDGVIISGLAPWVLWEPLGCGTASFGWYRWYHSQHCVDCVLCFCYVSEHSRNMSGIADIAHFWANRLLWVVKVMSKCWWPDMARIVEYLRSSEIYVTNE